MKKKIFQRIALTGIVIVAILIIWAAYLRFVRGWDWAEWTGFGASSTPDGTYYSAKTLWDWLQLLIIPVALAGGAWWLETSERKVDRQLAKERAQTDHQIAENRAQTDQEIAVGHQQQAVLEAYYDRMANLLLEKSLRKSSIDDEVRNIARARTLATLRALDGGRKGQVIQFLYESGLISGNNSIIDLSSADLQNVVLPYASLQYVNLQHVNLKGANLEKANLERANLEGADLGRIMILYSRSLITEERIANLEGADLQDAKLQNANLRGVKLQNANLQGAILSGTIFRDSHYNASTTWPAGFDPKAAGAILDDH